MSRINVLPKSVAELIAAGEVVERPASVIKELLENSIDAHATDITVEIKNGGILFMRVTDNGDGIVREDIRKAFLSHATSKITLEQDLDSIMTLGFRGEALASICAVSKVEVLTRPEGENIGTRYCIESGEEVLLDDAGCPKGTTIIVRDLFYSTPARMKFLKKDVSEGNTVAGIIDKLALSHPEISFRFIRDGKQVLLTTGKGDILTAAREVLGKSFAETLIPASGESGGIKVNGYISAPHASRPNRNMQYFFINGRFVRTGTGSAALSEAYKNSVMVGKFPSCVLFIELAPTAVDVNVHPTKTEVRFADEKNVFNAVFFACKNALSSDRSRAQFVSRPAVKQVLDFYAPVEPKAEQIPLKENKNFWQEVKVEKPVQSEKPAYKPNAVNTDTVPPKKESNSVVTFHTSVPVGYGAHEDDVPSLIPQKPVPVKTGPEKPVEPEKPEQAAEEQPEQSAEDFRLIGEAFRTYIIVECDKKLLVIDKHAAHERMIYEKLKANAGEVNTQVLLLPVTVNLTKEEYSAVLENLDILGKAGFAVEDFGSGAVICSECPMELTADDVSDAVCEIAGGFVADKRTAEYEKIDNIYHSVACRSAIKAGDFTTRLEMERFVKRLLSMPQIRCCPHGRPVMIEITQRELEKNFGRV